MHPPHLRDRALTLRADGVPFGVICRTLELPRSTVANWFYGERARRARSRPAPDTCPRCRPEPGPPSDPPAYAYLLGLYLGDGHLVTRPRTPVLRIYCTATWPGLIDACDEAMRAVLAHSVQRVPKAGCVTVQSYSRHWPCLIPQHGAGHKHHRRIALTEWQEPLIAGHPADFVRGLLHSDGCRTTNRIRRGDKTYVYPRYHFSNESADVMGLCQDGLDRLGVAWRMARPNCLSVARREAVAVLDLYVGPKY